MILKVDLDLLKLNISIEQLVVLSALLDKNQKKNQKASILSLVDSEELKQLEQRNFIISETGKTKDYQVTDTLKNMLNEEEERDRFQQFYDLFPSYIVRPDGTKDYLRGNVNRCRTVYNNIIGESATMHDTLIKCINYENEQRLLTGKTGYMKRMWKWLTTREWESYIDSIESDNTVSYGNDLIW